MFPVLDGRLDHEIFGSQPGIENHDAIMIQYLYYVKKLIEVRIENGRITFFDRNPTF